MSALLDLKANLGGGGFRPKARLFNFPSTAIKKSPVVSGDRKTGGLRPSLKTFASKSSLNEGHAGIGYADFYAPCSRYAPALATERGRPQKARS